MIQEYRHFGTLLNVVFVQLFLLIGCELIFFLYNICRGNLRQIFLLKSSKINLRIYLYISNSKISFIVKLQCAWQVYTAFDIDPKKSKKPFRPFDFLKVVFYCSTSSVIFAALLSITSELSSMSKFSLSLSEIPT